MSAASAVPADRATLEDRAPRARRMDRLFEAACAFSTWLGLGVLVVLLCGVLWQGAGWLTWSFLTSYDSRHPQQAGVLAGVWGTIWLIVLSTLFAVPIGVGAAIFLEEYEQKGWLRSLIEVNLANLAGVPSIVYGILGMAVFVKMFGAFEGRPKVLEIGIPGASLAVPLPFGRTVLSGGLTLAILILPIVIVATREALRAVPSSIREASYALGATHWQTIRRQVLPAAVPGIFTGVILAVSRAMGETAPLLMIGGAAFVASTPGGFESLGDLFRHPRDLAEVPFDAFTALPIQIFYWISRPQPEYRHVAAAAIIVLLVLLQIFNVIASIVRSRTQSRVRW